MFAETELLLAATPETCTLIGRLAIAVLRSASSLRSDSISPEPEIPRHQELLEFTDLRLHQTEFAPTSIRLNHGQNDQDPDDTHGEKKHEFLETKSVLHLLSVLL